MPGSLSFMRVKYSALASQLEHTVPVYILLGTEALLIEESANRIRKHCRTQGFVERHRLTVEPGFDWQELRQVGQAMSLFSSRQLIELRMPSGKPGDAGSKVLQQLARSMSPDLGLMVICGKLDKRAQNVKWFKTLENTGLVVDHPSPTSKQLPAWIKDRLSYRQLRCDAEVVPLLIYFLEGNLLAVDQEIRKLKLIYGNTRITAEQVRDGIADMGRFTVYDLIETCHKGIADRALRIARSLHAEGDEPVLINWALAREIRLMIGLRDHLQRGEKPGDGFRKFGVWQSRIGLMSSVLKRLPAEALRELLIKVAHADQGVKGRRPSTQIGDFWDNLDDIVLAWCGISAPHSPENILWH